MHYFRLILWPSVLVLDPEWPLYHSVFAGPVLSSTLLILAVVGLAHLDDKAYSGQSFTPPWWSRPALVFITIIPSSGLVPLPDLEAEHRSYLPSVGIYIACALLLDFIVSKLALLARFQLGMNRIVAVMIIMLCLTTWQHNSVWSSGISL